MLKKIPTRSLTVGMYVHDLDCGWMDHPFLVSHFKVDDASMIRKILAAGIAQVVIDTSRGADISAVEAPADAALVRDVAASPAAAAASMTVPPQRSLADEVRQARKTHDEACKTVSEVLRGVRAKLPIDVQRCDANVEDILESVLRKPDALLPLAQMKTRDEYTFQHSVAVSALAVAFGKALAMPRNVLKDLAMGGLLHDVGKAMVPEAILNKPAKLTAEEYEVMKTHASHGADLLGQTPGVSAIAVKAAGQHHERYDGSGYPSGLKGEEISLYGRVLAIADVYDAITSLRIYHKGMPPTEALRRMFEWGGSHFDPQLVQTFIKTVGIYPTGSLVRMESGKMGIVREVMPERLLQPVVKIFYDAESRRYLPPEVIDLADSNDRIAAHESFEKWNIDQTAWLA